MSPAVSIVIPCCNDGQFIEQAVDSCLKSSFSDIEIIVVDYGSTNPDTLEILNRLNKPKTRIIHRKNKGLPFARNRGIQAARGEYILSLDADDMLHPNFIEKAFKMLESSPQIGFVYSGYRAFGAQNFDWEAPPFHSGRLLIQNFVCISSLFRKKAWRDAGGYNERMTEGYEDWDFWISLVECGWIGGAVPEPLFNYRVYHSAATDEDRAKHERLTARIRNNHPRLYRQDRFYELLYDWLRDELQARRITRQIFPSGKHMDPIVSVVIPCYNYGEFVEDAINSCLNSTFQEIEIIVVNNGSTDPFTIETLNRLDKPKTRVVHIEKNIGLPYGRNFGIKAAKGKYILPLDADDKIHSTYIEKAYRVMEDKPQVGFVTCGMEYFGDDYWVWMPPPFDFDRLLLQNYVNVASLFRKKAWQDVGGYNESMLDGYEDWDFWISLAEKGWLGDTIEEVLFFYRRHGKTMSHDAGQKHEFIYKQIQANHPDLYRH